MNCRLLHLFPCGLRPFRASSCAAMATRRSRSRAAMRHVVVGLPRSSATAGGGAGWERQAQRSSMRESRAVHPSDLCRQALVPERTLVDVRIALGFRQNPLIGRQKFCGPPALRPYCCISVASSQSTSSHSSIPDRRNRARSLAPRSRAQLHHKSQHHKSHAGHQAHASSI